MMKATKTSVWVAAAAVCFAGGVAHATASASRPKMAQAVKQYLTEHGDLCVGKSSWPRFVTEEDRQSGSNDALQLPVLERLGLVESASGPAGSVKRYSLTAKGRQFYLQKKVTILGAHDRPVERDADFCVARLSLDKVVKWTPPEQTHGHVETVVSYTYNIRSADWMADPEARKVFPVVDRIIRGKGNAVMTATLQAQNGKWVPVLPGQ